MYQRVLQRVFTNPRYLALAIVVALVVFAIAVWLPNWRLILVLATSPTVTAAEVLGVLAGLLASIGTNFTLLSATVTIGISLLFGINSALFVYYFLDAKKTIKKTDGMISTGGLLSGMFGIGCATCGTFVVTSVLALVGAGSAVATLPFGGEEFGVLGIGLLGYATYRTIKHIDAPVVCSV